MKLIKIQILVAISLISFTVQSQTITDIINCDTLNYFQKPNTIRANDSIVYKNSTESDKKFYGR